MQKDQDKFVRQQLPVKMGSAGTGCNRRIRAAAGLDGFAGLDGSAASRPDREQAGLRGSECDRSSSEGRYRSCSASASGSGASSDEEHEPQEHKGFNSRRIRYVQCGRPLYSNVKSQLLVKLNLIYAICTLLCSPSGSENGCALSRASSGPAGGFGHYRSANGSNAGSPGLPLFAAVNSGAGQDKLQRYGSSIAELLAPGSPGQLSRQTSQKLSKETDRLDSRLNLSSSGTDDAYLSPDVPLIYVSCISILVLLYFILFVDGKALVSLPCHIISNPRLHSSCNACFVETMMSLTQRIDIFPAFTFVGPDAISDCRG